jgi:hypothetical protein
MTGNTETEPDLQWASCCNDDAGIDTVQVSDARRSTWNGDMGWRLAFAMIGQQRRYNRQRMAEMLAAVVDPIYQHAKHLLLFIAQPIPGIFYRRFVVNVKGLV